MINIKNRIVLILILFTLCFSQSLWSSDNVLDLIDQGKKAYKEDNYDRAHDILQQALSEIQNKISISFKSYLPEAPSGWAGQEVQSQSISSSNSSDNARYVEIIQEFTSKSNDNSVEVLIGNSPKLSKPYMEIAKMVEKSDMKSMVKKTLKEERNIEIEQKNGWYIFHEQEDSDEFRITALQEGIIVRIMGADSEKLAQKFLDRTDLKGLNESIND